MLRNSVELCSVDIPADGEFRMDLPVEVIIKLFRGRATVRPIVLPCRNRGDCAPKVYEIVRIEIISEP